MKRATIFNVFLVFSLLMSIFILPVGAQSPSTATSSFTLQNLQAGTVVRTLYVDGLNGNDTTADGSSMKPWKTIKKAVGYLKPGDVLSIMGGVYKERFTLTKSGTASSRIVIGSFGNGEVIIDGSSPIGEWMPYTDTTIKGIYKAVCSFKPRAVVVNEQPIFPAFSLTDIKEDEWYYDSVQATIYLYPKAGIVPTKDNIGVIIDNDTQDGIRINGASYITLYGLTIRYAGGRGITIRGNYNEVIGCNVKFNGHTGINIWHDPAVISTDNLVQGNNIYYNFMKNWPRGKYKWGGWGAGTNSGGSPNTKFIGNISHKNGGEGILAYAGPGGTIFKNNISFDNWSVNIYIDNQPNAIVDGNIVFSSEPNPRDLYHNGDTAPGDNRNLKRLRPEGICTADESYNLTPPANLNNVHITNNIIVGCRRGIVHVYGATGSGFKNSLVANNIIVVPNAAGIGENFTGIRIDYNHGNNVNSIFENNLIYAINISTYSLYLGTDPAITINPKSTTNPSITFKGLTFNGNTWYHATNLKPFHVGPDYHTYYDVDFTKWHSICGANCINDAYSNITAKITLVLDKIASIKATYK